MKKLIFSFFIALSLLKVSAQSILLTPGNQTTTNTAPDLVLRSTNDPDIRGTRSSGTIASPTPVTSGSSLLRLRGRGFWSTVSSTDQVAIDMHASENWTSSANGTNIRFYTTANGGISMSERMRIDNIGNVGIGTTAPDKKLHVFNGSSGIASFTSTSNFLVEDNVSHYIQMGSPESNETGVLFGKPSNSASGGIIYSAANNLFFRTGGNNNRMRIESNGNVGIGSFTSDFPLHLTNSSASISSTTGSFAIGATSGLHLIFDTDEINAYNGVNPGTLYLNPNHNGKIQIGSGSTGNLDVNGFSNLGDGAPAIKMKKFSGTIPLSATTHSIAHGLTKTKILGLQIFVESSVTGSRYLPNDGAAGTPVHYEIQLDNTNIVFQNIGTNLDGEPYIIVVTYEQ